MFFQDLFLQLFFCWTRYVNFQSVKLSFNETSFGEDFLPVWSTLVEPLIPMNFFITLDFVALHAVYEQNSSSI